MKLPSERYVSGDPRPVGFIDDVDSSHIGRASELISGLARYGNEIAQSQEGSSLRIRFCHVQYAPGMPFHLFGFNVWGVDEDGELADPFEQGEVHYALVVNQPVDLQIEVAIAFLMELARRQRLLLEVRDNEALFRDLPAAAQNSDESAATDVIDNFRHGWKPAMRAAVEEANRAGLVLDFAYEVDVFPQKNDLDRRLRWLRTVYNEVDAVQSMVDKTVSMVGGRQPSMRATGGAEIVREFTQQQLALLDLRRYTNHATRDGEVCGNGYLVTLPREPFAAYCAKPEEVSLREGDPRGILVGDRFIPRERVVHVKGIPQLESPYGISLLEPFVFAIHRTRTLGSVLETSSRWLGATEVDSETREVLEARVDLAKRMMEATSKEIDRLLQFFAKHVAEPEVGLYLPGHELYEL